MWDLDHKEGWAPRTDAFKLWCWRRPLRVPRTARSNYSILKEINPEYSLERLVLKWKLQYFGHLIQRANSLEKTLMLGKIEGMSRKGWQRRRWLDGITDSMDMSFSKLRKMEKDRKAWRTTVHGVSKSLTWQSNWTTTDSQVIQCLVSKDIILSDKESCDRFHYHNQQRTHVYIVALLSNSSPHIFYFIWF